MHRFFSILAVVALATVVRGQAKEDVGDKERAAVKKHAQDSMNAYTKGEHARFADLVCPEVLELVGGRDKLIALMKKVDDAMKANAVTYGPVTVGDPGKFARMGKTLVTTIPFTVEYAGPGVKRKDESYLIGFSTDQGKTWKFADGRKLTRDNVKDVFPKFPDGIDLPGGKGK